MNTTIAAEGALSDEILQAARALVDRTIANGYAYAPGYGWHNCGVKNPPLLTLLDMLIGACHRRLRARRRGDRRQRLGRLPADPGRWRQGLSSGPPPHG